MTIESNKEKREGGADVKRLSAAFVIATLMAAALAPPVSAASKRKPRRVERVVEAAYSTPAPAVTVGGDIYGACHTSGIGCVPFTPQPTEAFIASVEIIDASGQPVHALIEHAAGVEEVCGATDETIFLGSGDPFLVWIFAGPCANGTPALATFGTVRITLSNQP